MNLNSVLDQTGLSNLWSAFALIFHLNPKWGKESIKTHLFIMFMFFNTVFMTSQNKPTFTHTTQHKAYNTPKPQIVLNTENCITKFQEILLC